MAEREPARGARDADQVGVRDLVERGERARLRHAGDAGGDTDLERLAGDRRAVQQRERGSRAGRELGGDRRADGPRDAVLARTCARQLLDEERVAAALLVDGAAGAREQPLGVVAAERPQRNAPSEAGRVARWPARDRQQHARVGRAVDERRDQLDRGRVGPVQVVQQQRQPAAGGEPLEQRPHRAVEAVALLHERRAARVRERRQRGEDRRQFCEVIGTEPGEAGRIQLA
jgi:hypothetical protein